jgi:hypothetical protein
VSMLVKVVAWLPVRVTRCIDFPNAGGVFRGAVILSM